MPHPHATDIVYTYAVGGHAPAKVKLTKRELPNGDYFLFTELRNPQRLPLTIDLIQTEGGLQKTVLHKYSQHQIKKMLMIRSALI